MADTPEPQETFISHLVELRDRLLRAIIAVVVVYVLILLGFAIWGRHRLVLSPEEEYALSGGLHGDPQKEGYDAMEGEMFDDKK